MCFYVLLTIAMSSRGSYYLYCTGVKKEAQSNKHSHMKSNTLYLDTQMSPRHVGAGRAKVFHRKQFRAA